MMAMAMEMGIWPLKTTACKDEISGGECRKQGEREPRDTQIPVEAMTLRWGGGE